MEPVGFLKLSNPVPKSEPLPETVTWYSRPARLRTSSFSAPPLNEASLDTRIAETPPPLLDTRLEASAHNVTSLAAVIREYFESGHRYEVILDMLKINHEISVSLRTLKTHLKEAGLFRRCNYSPLPEVRHAIMTELRGPGQLFGYRTMWQVLKQKHKLTVKRDIVMRLLRQLNPQGIAARCGATNNNPAIIAHNYISCVKSLGVIPMRLRTDFGTENGTLAAIQCTLRHAHMDHYAGSASHSYGSSTGNQRIESWWSFLRRGRSQFWMDLFGDLRDSGNFNGSHEHRCLLRFCFRSVVQKDLDECKDLWNKHRIRPSRLASCPGGIPNELYLLPHRYGSRDCGFAVEESELDVFPEARQVPELCGDPNIEEYLQQAVQQHGLQQPQDWESASELYLTLKDIAGFKTQLESVFNLVLTVAPR